MSAEQPESPGSSETQATHNPKPRLRAGKRKISQSKWLHQLQPSSAKKNPKRVAAGKADAAKTRLAREAQKKAAAEAVIIISNNKAKDAANPPLGRRAAPNLPAVEAGSGALSTTQWLAAGSIVVSLIGLHYKREQLKVGFKKTNTPVHVDSPPYAPGAKGGSLQPTPEQATPPPQPKRGVRHTKHSARNVLEDTILNACSMYRVTEFSRIRSK